MSAHPLRYLGFVAIAAAILAACAPIAATLEAGSPEALVKTLSPSGTDDPAVVGAEVELIGTIELMAPTAWTLNGKVLAILPATKIDGTFMVGDLVKAHAAIQADGVLAAREIEAVQTSDGTALTVLGAEYDFTGTIDAMAIDEWTVLGTNFAVTSQTEIKGAFAVGDLVKVHLLVRADGALVAREIEAPEAELEDADEGDEVELVGVIESMGPEAWVIGGQTLAIAPETEIDGTFAIGDAVKVHVIVGAGGALTAREIEAAEVGDMDDDDGDDDNNANSNENENENESEDENKNGSDDGSNSNANESDDDNSNDNGSY